MSVTGRRIGRIVGQLDDLSTLAESYRDIEEGQLREALDALAYHIGEAHSAAGWAVAIINDRDPKRTQ